MLQRLEYLQSFVNDIGVVNVQSETAPGCFRRTVPLCVWRVGAWPPYRRSHITSSVHTDTRRRRQAFACHPPYALLTLIYVVVRICWKVYSCFLILFHVWIYILSDLLNDLSYALGCFSFTCTFYIEIAIVEPIRVVIFWE